MQAREALDQAKRLQGHIVRLAERRERQVQRATGEFQLDLLAAIEAVPDGVVSMVMQAVRLDPGQAYLQLALSIALDERLERRARMRGLREVDRVGDLVMFDGDGDAPLPSEAETEPPPRFEIEGDAGALAELDAELESPMEGDDARPLDSVFGEAFERLAQPGKVGGYRYPEPGEPATVLPDGTVVALAADPLDSARA
jgi:hypothetical protein